MTSPFAQFDSLSALFASREPGGQGIRPGIVLGITLLLSFMLGPAIVERIRWSKVSQGLLVRDIRVAESPDDARQCRSDACSFDTAAPAPAPPASVRMRFEPDPVKRYPIPAQFTYRYSMPAHAPGECLPGGLGRRNGEASGAGQAPTNGRRYHQFAWILGR